MFFHVLFLNIDISVNMAPTPFKFGTSILGVLMEGSLSPNFHVGYSFHFMKCRNLD